jgi:hypothetical protein
MNRKNTKHDTQWEIGTLSCKPSHFRRTAKWRCGGNHPKMQRSGVKGSKLWWGCEGYVSVVMWNEGKVMVKCECISSWRHIFYYCYCLGSRMLIFYQY